jgi:hypothetical protein
MNEHAAEPETLTRLTNGLRAIDDSSAAAPAPLALGLNKIVAFPTGRGIRNDAS